jgi:hypothetical protein
MKWCFRGFGKRKNQVKLIALLQLVGLRCVFNCGVVGAYLNRMMLLALILGIRIINIFHVALYVDLIGGSSPEQSQGTFFAAQENANLSQVWKSMNANTEISFHFWFKILWLN